MKEIVMQIEIMGITKNLRLKKLNLLFLRNVFLIFVTSFSKQVVHDSHTSER